MRKTGIELAEINYANGKHALTAVEVEELVAKAGSVTAVLNTRHAVAKDRGWVAKPPPAKEFAKAVVAEPNLLRRPILIVGGRVIIGFDQAAYAKLK